MKYQEAIAHQINGVVRSGAYTVTLKRFFKKPSASGNEMFVWLMSIDEPAEQKGLTLWKNSLVKTEAAQKQLLKEINDLHIFPRSLDEVEDKAQVLVGKQIEVQVAQGQYQVVFIKRLIQEPE